MLTPQDISEKGFVKALINGYDMKEVDDFLEAVSADYNALYKENAILKGKLKVLVEKVEEYRSTEDAMRMALLTAQRMGEEITVEATRAKEEMLLSADTEIKAKLAETARRCAEEEIRLSAASKETAKFLELSQAIIRKHSEFLKRLETAHRAVKPKRVATQAAPAPEPAPPPPPVAAVQEDEFDSVAAQIGNAVEKIANETADAPMQEAVTASLAENTPVPEAPPQSLFEDDDEEIRLYAADDDEDITSPRPKFDFDDLKFGANFDIDD
jgi:cell division initiation protein